MCCRKCCTFLHHNPVLVDYCAQASRLKFGVVTVSPAFALALIKLTYELLAGELDLSLGKFTFLNERGLKAIGFPKWVEKSRGKRPHVSPLRRLLSPDSQWAELPVSGLFTQEQLARFIGYFSQGSVASFSRMMHSSGTALSLTTSQCCFLQVIPSTNYWHMFDCKLTFSINHFQ